MNVFKLILDASPMVKGILLILLFFSVFSWAIIIYKRRSLKSAGRQSQRFLEIFEKSRNLSEVNEAAKRYAQSPLAWVFQAGYKELSYLAKANPRISLTPANVDSLSRALNKAANNEVSKLERMMSFLATTGSVTPFIGLFGTVWGIMDAFHKIGVVRSASLVTVAPGIAEALITTAVGLFAAIPAVIAYNAYLTRIKDLISQMEDFSAEFLGIVEKLYGA
ncbi:MAG: protein TolQ [Candidatus Aminicenantales bacterium]